MSNFNAEDLLNAVTGGQDVDTFYDEETETWTVPTVIYVDKDGEEREYSWSAAEDERGFKKIARIEDVRYDNEDDVYNELSDNEFTYDAGFLPGFGNFKMIDNGNLGDGHEAWCLVEHESGRLFRIEGWYSSHGESGWDSIAEVVPAEVKVVRYQDIATKVIFDNPAVTV